MGLLVHHSYLQAAPVTLAADLARYGSEAHWKGIYYRGEKIGFSVSQVVPRGEGYELQEDGQLMLTLMGMTVKPSQLKTRVEVDASFAVEAFSFSLDPGTGPIAVEGTLEGTRLELGIRTPGGFRTETRELAERPALALNLPRRLAAEGLETGKRFEVPVFDPATLQNAVMVLDVGKRELVRVEGRPLPAFRVETRFAGVEATSWVTDTGEVVKEESALGLVVLRESAERATAMAVPGDVRADMIEGAAIVPETPRRIDEPTAVRYLKLQLSGAELDRSDLDGAGQSVSGDVFEIRDPRELQPDLLDPAAEAYLASEPSIESDDPAIVAESRKAVAGGTTPREKAELLVRHVSALLEKKPTVSLPSALEVLRTQVGDCNEHTVLYVALARAAGLPARIAVGLVHLQGAFFYHAWPEVYIAEGGGGLWLPVDPTLNQFPADATHLRLARGGLERQASILPLVGRARIRILELDMDETATPILVGQEVGRPTPPLPPPSLGGTRRSCWSWLLR